MNYKKDISISVPRHDAKDKISGKAKYLNDIQIDNFLWAKTLRSTKARAKIINIKYPDIPEGYYIIDYRDVPGRNRVKTIEDDQPIFAEGVVNYIGEPIALIAGKNKEIILDIISKIEIEYVEINPIYSMDDALYKDKSILKPLFMEDNLFANYKINHGDVDEVFKTAHMVYEGVYSTGYQEHLYLETQSVMGVYDNNEILVYGSMQCPYYVKAALIQALAMEEDKVNVVQTTTGGAFGGKEEYPSQLAAQVAVAALKCKSKVKLILERDEDIEFTTKRHPSKISIKGAVDKNNKLIALDIDIKLDGGAYAGLSKVILQRAMFASTAAYYVPELRISGKAIATNTLIGGAYRGFGAPQSIFAMESFMEQFSLKLGISPLKFRKKNFLKTGNKSCTNGVFREFIPLEDMYKRLNELTTRKEHASNKLIGTGYSFFYHGCGFTGSGEKDHIKAEVLLVKDREKVEVLISNVEMGQGASITLRKIVAHTLDIPLEKTKFVNPDTRRVPDSGPTVASRTIMIVGKLLYDASIELKQKWTDGEYIEVRKNYVHPKGFEWNEEELKGDAYNSYSWGANAVEVEVDPITYQVKVRKIWTVFDIGKAIDERIVMGQIDGGIIQGLGYASIEVMRQYNGKIQQRTNTDYIIPTSMDFPNIHKELINNPYELGPYGAKGLGEITFVGIPVAYSNAVSNALNMGIYDLPITPETLMRKGE
ncbi:xanthine dehydrogenase family protein molybdopterin-binding subunit [Oceanirhabdus sp. W0125-5]|nr:xanthine dehydrogenase family protein molybdopterin-binding subunit [Oceanirhabdus sp. W0125-5]WBW99768.1 xanthine dehydrogenase family protein molybdopterin-binding subunit [Oceanirhabdus sp. W0125-5]